ncbi:MAG: hypothetical protein FVQ83_11595 [Chloroflexi bacterium]|nr:hypothetical protein [Chloroflexota bacterium]
MPIKLNSITQIPNEIQGVLINYESVFAECEFMDAVLQYNDLRRIAEDLNELCLQEDIIGYHFTNAIRENIEARGLEVGLGTDRRRDFIARFGYRFSLDQCELIHQMWESYFDTSQNEVRDGRIWFNLTLSALKNGGAKPLLNHFGGEIIYMPLIHNDEIAEVLRTIGRPLIVVCAIAPETLKSSFEIQWGKIWLSSYHLNINQDAVQEDADVYSTVPISSDQIVSIRVDRSFRNS